MVRCLEGDVPADARRRLQPYHQDSGYLLACQCRPTGSMLLAPRSAEHSVTACVIADVQQDDDGHWLIRFEPFSMLSYRPGYLARIMSPTLAGECQAVFMNSADDGDYACIKLEQADFLPDWLNPAAAGVEFCLRGPLPVEPEQAVTPLPPDPALWDALGGDAAIRAVLVTFYGKVYADPLLRPFFERVTIDRIIGKQFAFLKENIQGDPVYLGEQPRNSHHWMVINDATFDHRQTLMLQAMHEHGIGDGLIARWLRYEEQFRPEIVKYKPWLKRIGDLLVDTEQYEECVLDDATVCDYCGAEIAGNTRVRYHKRIGKIGCEACCGVPEETQ
jgi:truncated hemoglobin YjbI